MVAIVNLNIYTILRLNAHAVKLNQKCLRKNSFIFFLGYFYKYNMTW